MDSIVVVTGSMTSEAGLSLVARQMVHSGFGANLDRFSFKHSFFIFLIISCYGSFKELNS